MRPLRKAALMPMKTLSASAVDGAGGLALVGVMATPGRVLLAGEDTVTWVSTAGGASVTGVGSEGTMTLLGPRVMSGVLTGTGTEETSTTAEVGQGLSSAAVGAVLMIVRLPVLTLMIVASVVPCGCAGTVAAVLGVTSGTW